MLVPVPAKYLLAADKGPLVLAVAVSVANIIRCTVHVMADIGAGAYPPLNQP